MADDAVDEVLGSEVSEAANRFETWMTLSALVFIAVIGALLISTAVVPDLIRDVAGN